MLLGQVCRYFVDKIVFHIPLCQLLTRFLSPTQEKASGKWENDLRDKHNEGFRISLRWKAPRKIFFFIKLNLKYFFL